MAFAQSNGVDGDGCSGLFFLVSVHRVIVMSLVEANICKPGNFSEGGAVLVQFLDPYILWLLMGIVALT